jgi:hypothetical protein
MEEVARFGSVGDGAGVKYKMIAVDLDGTLLSPSGQVTPRTKSAIHKALQAGLQICFATGRNFTESQAVLDAVAHYDPAVFVGGALIIDTRERVTLHRTLMDGQLARDLAQFFESHGHAALALQDRSTAGVDYLATRGFDLNRATDRWLKVTRATVRRSDDLAQHPHDHTIRVGIVAAAETARIVHDELRKTFSARATVHCLFTPDGLGIVEAFDPSVNKWRGILHVARGHNVEPSQIVAVGDDVNDLSMIQNAGLGIAMGNACPELLQCAGRVIGRNDEEGLAIFLEELAASN